MSGTSPTELSRNAEQIVARLAAAGVTLAREPAVVHNFGRSYEREVVLCARAERAGYSTLDRALGWSVGGRSGGEVHLDDAARGLRGAGCVVAYATRRRPDVLRLCSLPQLAGYERALVDIDPLAACWRHPGAPLAGHRVVVDRAGAPTPGLALWSSGLDEDGLPAEAGSGRLLVALRVPGSVDAWYPLGRVEVLGPVVPGWYRPRRAPALPPDAASVASGSES